MATMGLSQGRHVPGVAKASSLPFINPLHSVGPLTSTFPSNFQIRFRDRQTYVSLTQL